jgi:hypothetical protein
MHLPARGSRSWTIARWAVGGGLLFLVATGITLAVILNPGHLRSAAEKKLSERLGLDVTSRILAATSVTQRGLDVPSARVPKGSHQLLLEIRDDAGNVGRSGLVFEVGD